AHRCSLTSRFSRRPSRRRIEQLADRFAHPLRFSEVASSEVRIGDKETVALKVGVSDELFNGFAIFRAFETIPHAKDLVEPRASFSQDILEIGLEVAVVDDRYQHPGIVVDQRRAEVVQGANSTLPICRLGLNLRYALAEQFGSAGGKLTDEGNFSLFPDALARPVGLTGDRLRHRCAFVLDHFRVHCNLLMAGLLLYGVGARWSNEQMLLPRCSPRAPASGAHMRAASCAREN